MNDLWCFDYTGLIVHFMQWNKIITAGDRVEGRYRFAFTSFKENDVDYFAVFGGHSKRGKLNDVAL